MYSYGKLEKILHRLALSTQLIREASFDIESSLISSRASGKSHVFIAGMARSGTTILLNSLYKSDIFASLTYSDMPFVLAPNIWAKFSFIKSNNDYKERAHGDGINFSIRSPEAFEEVFWKTFAEKDPESRNNFRLYVNNINFKYGKERYLSKNNQNIKRIILISKIFPDAKILIPFRDPIQHAYSLLNQHKKFVNYARKDQFVANYMKWIGHTEFGPNYHPIFQKRLYFKNYFDINHWLEQWYLVYKNSYVNFSKRRNIFLINYHALCTNEKYWLAILKLLEIKERYNFKFKESRKEISLEINNALKIKVTNLYEKLNELNFM